MIVKGTLQQVFMGIAMLYLGFRVDIGMKLFHMEMEVEKFSTSALHD